MNSIENVLSQSTVTLVRKSGQPKCKAVSVSPWLLISAHHCIKNESVEYIITDGNYYKQLPLEILITNEIDDLVLLKRAEPTEYWVPIQLYRKLKEGDNVLAGNVWTNVISLHWAGRSEVTAIYRTAMEINIKVEHGHSGSGLVDEYGYLVGICTGFDTKNNNGIYAPVDSVVALLQASGN